MRDLMKMTFECVDRVPCTPFLCKKAFVFQVTSESRTNSQPLRNRGCNVHNANSVEDSENFCTDQGSNGPKAKPTPPEAVQA